MQDGAANRNTHQLLLSPTQTAEALGVCSRTLASWRHDGIGPAYVRVSLRMIGYRPVDLDAWLTANRVEAAPESAAPSTRRKIAAVPGGQP